MSQQFTTSDVLRLEVEDDPTGLVNLVQNPSGELGGWGWVTPVAGSSMAGIFNDRLEYSVAAGVANYFYTEALPVAAGEYVAASWLSAASWWYRARFEWLNASQVVIGSTAQTGYLVGDNTTTENYGPHLAPASTAYVRLRFDVYSTNTGAHPTAGEFMWLEAVTVAKAATSAELGTLRANLVPNPSFETNTAGWEATSLSTIARSTAQAAVGTASLAMTATLSSTGAYARTPAGTAGIPVTGSQSYALQLKARAATTGRSILAVIYWYDADGGSLGTANSSSVFDTTTEWTLRSRTTTAPSNAAYAAVGLTISSPAVGEVHYLDAVMLEKSTAMGDYFDSSTPDADGVDYSSADHPTKVTTRTNLVTNPSFETNTTGWVAGANSAIARSSTVGGQTGSWALRLTASGGTGTVSTRGLTGQIPLTAGETYTISAYTRAGSVSRGVRPGLAVFNSAGTLLTTFVASAVANSTSAWTRASYTVSADTILASHPTTAYVAAAVMVDVAAVGEFHYFDAVLLERTTSLGTYFDGDTPDGTVDFGTVDRAWTGTAHASTSTETTSVTLPYSTATTSNLSYIEPVPYLDVLGPTHDIQVNREALNVSTLTATILDATLDPSKGTLIRPGRKCRLLALAGEAWNPVFTGTLSAAEVTYHLKDPNVPDQKRARIEMTAVDAISQLANQKRTEGVASVADLPYVLEGCGVPWNVNGSGNQVATAVVVANNENASAVDQVAVTRDSNLGYAWVDRYGVLQAWNAPQMPAVSITTLDESVYTDMDISYNTGDLINEVNIKFLRLNPTTGETEEVDYGPYRDEASISQWGVRSKEFTIQDVDEDPVEIEAYALAILTTNATPVVRINSVRFPVATTSDISPERALLDLYDLVTLVNTAQDMNHTARVTRIEHIITPDKWMVEVGFSKDGVAASPQFTPSPGGGAGGLTIGQLLRPVGEMTMFYGTVSAGWLECDGSTFSSTDYPRLAEYLGGTTLPNLVDRFPIGAGTKAVGTSGGSPTVNIQHSHTIAQEGSGEFFHVQTNTSGAASPKNSEYAGHNHGGSTGNAGSTALDVMNPWRAVRFAIRAV